MVTGHVRALTGGRPLPFTRVTLERVLGDQLEVLTLGNGEFTIRNVVPGNYRITAQRVGFEPRETTVTATGDDTTSVHFVLEESEQYARKRSIVEVQDLAGWYEKVMSAYPYETWRIMQYHGEVIQIDSAAGQVQLRVRSDEGETHEHWLISPSLGNGLVQLVHSVEWTEEIFRRASALDVGDRLHVTREWWGVRMLFATGE